MQSLPRVALEAASTSYVLRGNFGWREKFGHAEESAAASAGNGAGDVL